MFHVLHSSTLATLPVPRSFRWTVDIGTTQRMTALAMYLARVSARYRVPTQHIHPHRYRFQVIRVDAGSITTEVVKCQIIWNGSHEVLKCPPMGWHVLLPLSPWEELPVPARAHVSGPEPATTLIFIDKPFPSNNWVSDRGGHSGSTRRHWGRSDLASDVPRQPLPHTSADPTARTGH